MKIYRWAMRVGSPILFWLSVFVVLLSIFRAYDSIQQTQASLGVEFDRIRFITRLQVLMSAVAQSLLLGALPFGAAVLIHRLDKLLGERAEPRS